MYYENIVENEGRGLILYTHKSLNVTEVKMNTEFKENLFVEIHLKNREKLLVGLIYRSPSDKLPEENKKLRELINEAANLNHSSYILMGDFNYPSIDWNLLTAKNINSEEQKFLECLQDNYFFQVLDQPTRWRGTDTPNLLDLLITDDTERIEDIDYQSPIGKSDHCVITFNFICQRSKQKDNKQRKCYRKADYNQIKYELKQTKWEDVLDEQNNSLDDMWKKFHNKIKDLEEKYVPISKNNKNKHPHIPIDKDTIAAIKHKTSLCRKFIRTKDPEVRKKYNRARNRVSKLIKKCRKNYENILADDVKNNPKRIWRYINSKSKMRQGVNELCTDPNNEKSEKTEDDKQKANILASYFSSVFTKEPPGDAPKLQPRKIKIPWRDIIINPEEVEKLLKELKPDKSPGPDELHPAFLKELHKELSKPLSIIFTKSLNVRDVPKDWKIANVSAIFKKGKKSLASNYRPVSLTSIVCKTMEKIVRNHITEHMNNNSFFTNKQFGFMQGRSTALQLLKVLDEWTETIDSGYGIDVVYMDFQKAFDTVPHKRLIEKLKAYGIGNDMISWTQNFLQGRKQQVIVNGEKSNWHEVTSGIPQGSIVGPLMFIIFINDLPDTVTSRVYMFADDTKLFKIVKENEDREILQRDLEKLTEWTNTWLLKLHPEKCKYMQLGNKAPQNTVKYTLQGIELSETQEEKDIGVLIDNRLSFDSHISEKVKKAHQMFAVIRRNFNYLDKKSFIPLYKTLVRTHLDYANSVWAPYKIKHIEMLEGVQRRATKQIPGLSDLPYQERLRILKLPTLTYRRIRGDMIEVYKILTEKYDPNIGNFLRLRSEYSQRVGGRGHDMKLFQQRARLDIRKHYFTVRTCQTWNSLPPAVVNANNVNTFKNRLDAYWKNQELLHNYRAPLQTGSGNTPTTIVPNIEPSIEEKKACARNPPKVT